MVALLQQRLYLLQQIRALDSPQAPVEAIAQPLPIPQAMPQAIPQAVSPEMFHAMS
jgi:hypothetical protein